LAQETDQRSSRDYRFMASGREKRGEVLFEDMILLDLYYIYNRGLPLDLSILNETIFVVLGKRGAY